MIGFCPLASGSKGNSVYLGTSKTKILVDAGLSVKGIREKLAHIGVRIEEIDAILITHEHLDHIRGLQGLSAKWQIPILANSETAKAIYALLGPMRFKIFTTGEPFVFGDIDIKSFHIQHDAVEPVGFTFQCMGLKIGMCADLGFASSSVLQELKACDYLYVEANHEPSMVHACSRPMMYKHRVLSRLGHLSNQECADLLKAIAHPNLRHIYLAHLSSECNAGTLALKTVEETVRDLQLTSSVTIAFQDEVSFPILFGN